jgi:osmoprotectant transport system permease protein
MVAFNGVERTVKEAAVGMGMDSRQVLVKVEVPLALPVIVAGLRIGALSTISLATIAAWVGGLGLGQLLKDGINNESRLYAGIICIAGIAILTDVTFRLVERTVRVP